MLFSDRLEVWNPGKLPLGMTIQNLKKAHASIPRNPLVSEPLFWAKYIERAGTGTLDMISLCKKADLSGPEFRQKAGQFILKIKLKNKIQAEVLKSIESSIRSV